MKPEAPEDILFLYNEPLYTLGEYIDINTSTPCESEPTILILFLASELTTETGDMLKKMMAACRFTENDYRLSGLSNPQEVLPTIQRYRPAFCLLFGLALQSDFLKVNKAPNKPFRFGSIAMLQSEGLQQIARNPALKSSLWTDGLKVLFKL